MASTTQTTNYGLPLYQSSDRPAWTDTNTPFESLDTAVKTASDNASSAADAVTTLTSSLATLNQTVSGHTTQLSTLETAVASAATAQGTSFTAHGLNTATDVQTAIQNAGTAAINSYDNTDSGLNATNVQDAIDELSGDLNDIGTVYEYTLTTSHSFSANGAFDNLGSVTVPAGTYLICITGDGDGGAITDTLTKYRADVNTRDLATVRNINGYGQTASVSYVYTTDSTSTITLQGSSSSIANNPSTTYARLSAIALK